MNWIELDREAVRGTQEFEGLDPYATWSLGDVGKKHLFSVDAVRREEKPHKFQVLLELKDPAKFSVRDLADGTKLFDGDTGALERWRASVSIPRAYIDTERQPKLAHIKHVTAIVTDEFLGLLTKSPNPRLHEALVRVTLSRPVPRRAMCDRETDTQPVPDTQVIEHEAAENRVLVGIIDDGIAFGHERFRNADGTSRVESIWVQDGDPPSSVLFDYGREITKRGPQGIDQLLAASVPSLTEDSHVAANQSECGHATR